MQKYLIYNIRVKITKVHQNIYFRWFFQINAELSIHFKIIFITEIIVRMYSRVVCVCCECFVQLLYFFVRTETCTIILGILRVFFRAYWNISTTAYEYLIFFQICYSWFFEVKIKFNINFWLYQLNEKKKIMSGSTNKPLKIVIFLGSARNNRMVDRVCAYVKSIVENKGMIPIIMGQLIL